MSVLVSGLATCSSRVLSNLETQNEGHTAGDLQLCAPAVCLLGCRTKPMGLSNMTYYVLYCCHPCSHPYPALLRLASAKVLSATAARPGCPHTVEPV
jgi:hypothetical protein